MPITRLTPTNHHYDSIYSTSLYSSSDSSINSFDYAHLTKPVTFDREPFYKLLEEATKILNRINPQSLISKNILDTQMSLFNKLEAEIRNSKILDEDKKKALISNLTNNMHVHVILKTAVPSNKWNNLHAEIASKVEQYEKAQQISTEEAIKIKTILAKKTFK